MIGAEQLRAGRVDDAESALATTPVFAESAGIGVLARSHAAKARGTKSGQHERNSFMSRNLDPPSLASTALMSSI